MFGMGWAEMMIVGVVALIVVGPKELPIMFRKLGIFVGKARHMARDFSRAMNDAADSTGMKETMDSVNSLKDTVDTVKSPTKAWTSYTPGSETEKLAQQKDAQREAMKDGVTKRSAALKEQRAAEAAAADDTAQAKAPASAATPAKSPAAKKPAAAKTAARKPAAKKPAARKTAKPTAKPKSDGAAS
ncbi:MAG: Sec-independent protein translocase protein TatB [Pseudomonadota bacterium]